MARIVDDKFLLLPNGEKHYVGRPQNRIAPYHSGHPMNDGIIKQYNLNRNDRVGYIIMPLLGSRYDDWFLDAVAKGTLKGSGLTPVVDGEASNVIRRLQMMVYDWVINYISPFKHRILATSKFFSMAQDGAGIKKVISYMAGALLSMNTGFFYGLLPFHRPFAEWKDFGGEIQPLKDDRGEDSGEYVFRISDTNFEKNVGIWALDNLRIDPTGNPTWPFRILVDIDDGESAWVYIKEPYGGQILGELGTNRYDYAGFWPSPLYTYFGEMGVMNAMVAEYNYEGFFNAPPEGIVAMTSADTSNQLANIMEEHKKERNEQNSLYYPGIVWVSIENKEGKIFYLPFKKPSEGFSQEEFVKLKQRRLALSMGLSLNFVTLEIGVGAVHQAAVADMIAEITGISWIKNKAQHWMNHDLTPSNIQVRLTIPSSAATLQQSQTLETATRGVKQLQEATGGAMSPDQVIKIVEKTIGTTLPKENDDLSSDDTGSKIRSGSGDLPSDDDSDPDPAPDENLHSGGFKFLLSEAYQLAVPGMRVYTADNTPGTILSIDGRDVRVRHDWDNYTMKTDGHEYAIDELFIEVGK